MGVCAEWVGQDEVRSLMRFVFVFVGVGFFFVCVRERESESGGEERGEETLHVFGRRSEVSG